MNHYSYEEISIGQKESFVVEVKQEMLDKFKCITGDINYLHNDEDFAKDCGYKSKVVYGMLTASFLSTLAGVYLPGENSLIHSVNMDLAKPVYVGDILTVTGTVKEKNDLFRFIEIKTEIRNQDDVKVLRGSMKIGFLK